MFAPRFGCPVYPSQQTADWARRIATVLAILLLLALTYFMPGCGATPARQAFIGVDAATDAVNGVADAYDAKWITKEQVKGLTPYADALKTAQDNLDNAILAGKVDLNTYRQAVTDATVTLLNEKAAAKRAKPAATQP